MRPNTAQAHAEQQQKKASQCQCPGSAAHLLRYEAPEHGAARDGSGEGAQDGPVQVHNARKRHECHGRVHGDDEESRCHGLGVVVGEAVAK